MKRVPLALLAVAIIISGSLSGCSGDPDGKVGVNLKNSINDNLKRTMTMYCMFGSARNRAPRTQEELKEYILSDSAKRALRLIGVDPADFDATLIGDRDQEPLIIIYDMPCISTPGKGVPIVCEATGVEGVRLVASTDGSTKEVADEQAFQQLLKKSEKMEGKRAVGEE